MIILVGASASGKTEIAKRLIKTYGFTKFITHTTRKPRENEENHVDYHFVSLEEFNRLEASSSFIETTNYNGFKYGTSFHEIGPKKVLIVDPNGANSFVKKAPKDVCIFLIETPKEIRKERMLKRKDHLEDIEKRLKHDNLIFAKDQLDRVDYLIENNKTHLATLTKAIYDLYKKSMS
jgi:guanylate kinase